MCDSYFNQFTTKIVVSSTKETEPKYIENVFYQFYPKIREEDMTPEQVSKIQSLYEEQIIKLRNNYEEYKQKIIVCRKKLAKK